MGRGRKNCVLFDIPPLKKVRNGLEGIYKSDVFG
jgi:hypothetical protein